MIPKFRARDRATREIINSNRILKICFDRVKNTPNLLIYINEQMKTFIEIKESDKRYCNQFNLMQSTGLKDKNGVEIFEGDIVRVETRGGIIYGDVKYMQCSFMVCSEDMARIMVNCWDYETLGNIYENPELLEMK